MIFRRSLVRELTATAVGLFLVLLAILFTNLVLRLLARAAGGAVAPDGILALLGFNALFYFNILLSVALFLTVLLTLSRWYRDSEMIVWFTSGQSLIACLQPILLFAAPFLVAIVALSLFLSPWAEQRKIEFERQLESRDDIALVTPGLFREFSRREPRRVRREHQPAEQHRAERVPALGRGQAGRDDGRRARAARGDAERRPLHRAGARPPLPGHARDAPITGSSSSSSSDGASSPARSARCRRPRRRFRPPALRRRRRPRRARRAVLAHLGADLGAGADAARRAARLRQSADGTLVQPRRRRVPVHALQQLPQHRAEHDRAGTARILGRARCCRT